MSKGNIFTGLDIGTSSTRCLVIQKKDGVCEVLSYAEMPSFGLRKGAIVNLDNILEVTKNIQLIVSGIERDCGKRITAVSVNIGGDHVYVTPSDGIISVSRADQRISEDDKERVLQATRAINISGNDEILDTIPKEFVIDDRGGIKDPVGLTGVRLEARVLLLCYFQQYFTNLTQAVWGAKLQTSDIIASPLAAARAVLTPQQMELGVALIDIGHETTSLAVFEDGGLAHLAIFPVGSLSITKDIAIGLKTEMAMAESIKKQHGSCIYNKKDATVKEQLRKKIEIFEKSDSLAFNKKELVDIVEPRVSEILDLVQKELKSIGKHKMLPAGVVLTGGGAKLSKIKDLAKDVLELNCIIGTPKNIAGLPDDPALATVAGLALGGVDIAEDPGNIRGAGIFQPVWRFLKKAFKMFVP
jgi:cell division protein FtsA